VGSFSWDCVECGRSVKGPLFGSKSGPGFWMNRVVVTMPDGKEHRGPYDGYGRAAGFCYNTESEFGGPLHAKSYPAGSAMWSLGKLMDSWALDPCFRHAACRDAVGDGRFVPSRRSEDQGFWEGPRSLDGSTPEPRSAADVAQIRAIEDVKEVLEL